MQGIERLHWTAPPLVRAEARALLESAMHAGPIKMPEHEGKILLDYAGGVGKGVDPKHPGGDLLGIVSDDTAPLKVREAARTVLNMMGNAFVRFDGLKGTQSGASAARMDFFSSVEAYAEKSGKHTDPRMQGVDLVGLILDKTTPPGIRAEADALLKNKAATRVVTYQGAPGTALVEYHCRPLGISAAGISGATVNARAAEADAVGGM